MMHCMLDLETLSAQPTAAITAIGAVKFDPRDRTVITDRFYCAVDPQSSQQLGGHVDARTVQWWLQQSDAARAHLNDPDAIDLASALVGFLEWYGSDGLPTWGNGATFDLPILEHALTRCGFEVPWKFWQQRCFRTFAAIDASRRVKPEVAHHALSDAVAQAQTVQDICDAHGIRIG